MIPFPPLSDHPSGFEYFWHQLPWAVSGFLTFAVGMSLVGAALFALPRSGNKRLLISFIMLSAGFGSLGLVLGLRAVIIDLELLLLLNRILYFCVVWLSPGSFLFMYYVIERRYRPLLVCGIIALGTVAASYAALLVGYDFTGSWFHYPFGSYPIAALPLKLWGAIAALGYVVAGIPTQIHVYRHNREELRKKKYLFIGVHFSSLLVITNLPSLAGIPVFPLSTFAFLPLLVIAYGIFRGDFLNVNELLFQKRGLFKVLAAITTVGFVGIAVLAALTLKPADHPGAYSRPLFLIPLFSGVCAFGLAIYLAGSNPDRKLNMLAAASLMLAGCFMIVMTAFKLELPLVVARRIEQIFYSVFLFTPGVHLRFVYLALGKERPRSVYIADAVSLLLCGVLWTPYFFSGFYQYPFGLISVAGPGLSAFGALGLVASGAFLFSWWRGRGTHPNSLGGLIVLALVVGDLLILLNLPATMGIALYPLGDLQLIPAFMLALAVGRFGAIPVEGEATAIGNRVSRLILLLVPVSMMFYFLNIIQTTSVLAAVSHILLVASPLGLAFYMISFIFLRPTAIKMDETMRRLAEEKQRADEALRTTEEARREVEALSRFAHLINSHSDLKQIFKEVSKYVHENFGIAAAWLFVPDEQEKYLVSFRAFSYRRVPDAVYEKIINTRIPLSPEGGIAHVVWNRKKTLYLPRIRKFEFEFDRRLIEMTGATSFLHVPLVVNDRSVAIVIFSNVGTPMTLTKRDIRTVDTFCAQIAGAINNAHLLRQTEKQKADTAALNRLVKSLNEKLDVQTIMQKVHAYLKEKFGIEYYSLLSADAEKTHLRILASVLPDSVTDEERRWIDDFVVPMKKAKGAHGLILRRRKPAYFPNIDLNDSVGLSWLTADELATARACQVRDYLLIPLLLNNEPVAILNLSNSVKPMSLSTDEIVRLSDLGEQLAGIVYGSALFNEVQAARNAAETERRKSEKLLLNILPADVAAELKEKGATEPVLYENVSVMFTDFKGFTQIAETMSPHDLIQDLDACFVQFDKTTERFNLEKLKTIGDSYMCAGGIPKRNRTHAVDCVLAALEIQAFMNLMKTIKADQGLRYWELRLGIHSGPLVAGVIGEKKFAYDVWGDTVNTASRMESSGTAGKINISGNTFELVKDLFVCEYRGQINAKNKGEVAMYYVEGLKPEYAVNADTKVPNAKFWQAYSSLSQEAFPGNGQGTWK